MIEKREGFMVSSNGDDKPPKQKQAHFLKPFIDPTNQTLPTPPSLSLSSKPFYNHVNSWVHFKRGLQPQENWDTWVAILQQTHHSIWKKVAIFDAIRASTYKINRDNELIIRLAERWCPKSNTFIFPWGECTISLEDIMVLGGFSALGNSVRNPDPYQSIPVEEIQNELDSFLLENSMNQRNQATHYDWIKCFMGSGGDIEHIAFLVLWLSRCVFPSTSNKIAPHVFPIAITLARGIRIALAPAVLACIYRDLSLLKYKIVGYLNGSDDMYLKVALLAPLQLVQLWAWERFPKLCPRPITLRNGEPRLARWSGLKKLKIKPSMGDFESLYESFLWRPYTLFVENWEFPEFYGDEERLVLLDSEVRDELLSFARCLRSSELVGLDCIEQYCPHRVARQFGLDQEVPRWTPRLNCPVKLAWNSYNMDLNGLKLYLAARMVMGDVTPRYLDWLRKAFKGSDTNTNVLKLRKSPRFVPKVPMLELSNINEEDIHSTSLHVACSSAHGVGEISHIEDIDLNRSHSDEVMPIPNLQVASENAVKWMTSLIEKLHSLDSLPAGISRVDLLIEKLEKCRDLCANMRDVDNVADMHIETIQSYPENISLVRVGDGFHEGLPSQGFVDNEVASSPVVGVTEIVENTNRLKDNEDICSESPNDKTEIVCMNSGCGSSFSEPMIIDDSDADDDDFDDDLASLEALYSELNDRISKLEKEVYEMLDARSLRSLAK